MVSTPRICRPIQWLLYASVNSNGGEGVPQLYGPSSQGIGWPWTVPADRWLCLTNVQFGSKYGALGRSSYFVIASVITIPDVMPVFSCGHPSQAILLPPGHVLGGGFINNEFYNESGPLNNEPANMTAMVRGFIVDHQQGMSMFTALDGINFDSLPA